MRKDDFWEVLLRSALPALPINIISYFIFNDLYKSVTGGFWVGWLVIGFVLSIFVYAHVKSRTKCKACGKYFSLSEYEQYDIENFLKYKNERVRNSNSSGSELKNVPYNCRRYWQVIRCDDCGDSYKEERLDERRA